MKRLNGTVLLLAGLLCFTGCRDRGGALIFLDDDPDPLEQLAARELRRCLYQCTGELATIVTGSDESPAHGTWFRLGVSDSLSNPEEFQLRSREGGSYLTGGSPKACLYAVYHFAEAYLDMGFYLHGDVVPDQRVGIRELPGIRDISGIDEHHAPLFGTRGILPFHDFPEGPDWWDLEGYKAILSQLPKLKMNFIGMHTYPRANNYPSGYYQAEPLVWIGKAENIHPDGSVKRGYPVLHFHTGHDTWGYAPRNTSGYAGGASMLFDRDQYGPSYMEGISPWPHTEQENIAMFNAHGELLREAFTFARALGVKSCIGTETPLAIPRELEPEGDRDDMQLTETYYRGLFERISRTHPLDYYWLWTGENWTWQQIPDREVERVGRDMQAAVRALETSGAAFRLATCGWVLGPARDRAEFDRLLPSEVPFSCINREVGWDYIEPAFRELQGRPKWAIPWMEDDPALISPQLWVGRMRKDAVDALGYGCDGLIGIHWRTRNISPNVAALADAAWEMGEWKEVEISFPERDLQAGDFYREWAGKMFGQEAAGEIAAVFSSLDGGDFYDQRQVFQRDANLYRSTTWMLGPGGIHRNPVPWRVIGEKFRFIGELEELEPWVRGTGNRARFSYWLSSFRFEAAMARLGCVLGELDSLAAGLQGDLPVTGVDHPAVKAALQKREESVHRYDEVMRHMLEMVSTTGELGMIANLEGHNRGRLEMLTRHDSLLEARTGLVMGEKFPVSEEYRGPARITVPVARGILEEGEDLDLKVLILAPGKVENAVLAWRPLGRGEFREIPLAHVSRGVYHAMLSAGETGSSDIEYFLRAEAGMETSTYPVTAPGICQAVVYMPGNLKN